MPEGKLEFSAGSIRFLGEGNEDWLSEQLDKILAALPPLERMQQTHSTQSAPNGDRASVEDAKFTTTLAGHIKAKGAESNQVKRFLVTADWLRQRGVTKLTTGEVTKTLATNQQKRLGNSAECLNKNVQKGFCEKTGDGFFITPDGLKDLDGD
jgi:hypothetical protein